MNKVDLTGLKILVTGGAGFIGSNLCQKLLELNAYVICFDNLSTGYKKNISDFIGNKKFLFVKGDIRNFDSCIEITKNIDYVLHQAALGSVPRSIENPIVTNEVNTTGFINMLYASAKNNVKRFIYAASSSTYGDSEKLPKVEDHIGNPMSPYAITKYTNELYADVFSKVYKIDTIGLRYFNVFGKKQNINGPYAAVIPKFIDMIINKKNPVINGDGSYSRDFTHVDNVVQINIRALLTKRGESLNQVYNAAVGDRTSIIQLFELIKKYLEGYDKSVGKIVPIFGPVRAGDVPHSLASIEKAKFYLEYNPKIKIEKGLYETVKWFYHQFEKQN